MPLKIILFDIFTLIYYENCPVVSSPISVLSEKKRGVLIKKLVCYVEREEKKESRGGHNLLLTRRICNLQAKLKVSKLFFFYGCYKNIHKISC